MLKSCRWLSCTCLHPKSHFLIVLLGYIISYEDDIDLFSLWLILYLILDKFQDFFMPSSGKRKRDELPSQFQAGGFLPQQDGAGDVAPEVFEIEVCTLHVFYPLYEEVLDILPVSSKFPCAHHLKMLPPSSIYNI